MLTSTIKKERKSCYNHGICVTSDWLKSPLLFRLICPIRDAIPIETFTF